VRSSTQRLCATGDRAPWPGYGAHPAPFAALELSEPEPDVAIVPPGPFDRAHPHRAYLVIEVAESSLPVDGGLKKRLCAMCGVPEHWIVNLVDHCIEVYTERGDGPYAKVQRYERGQGVRPTAFADCEVRVLDIMS
jgi:Uma2 family endonuclease